jgi:D-serine deaminase-like pyridoxal phosphate-dependent protein
MNLHSLDTPSLLVDLDLMEANLQRMQAYCDAHGLAFRPHIKTHKIPAIAHQQVALGAVGIACQKLGEAEIMAEAGIKDILIPYNLVGPAKLERLAALARRATLTVAVDSAEVMRPIAAHLAGAGALVGVLIELDSDLHRCGLSDPGAVVQLAREISATASLRFRGVMLYPSNEASMPLVHETIKALDAAGLHPDVVSGGGVHSATRSHTFGALTEIRIGTYIFNDWTVVSKGTCTPEQCSLKVLVTVVSAPAPGRIIVDGGTKTFSSDGGFPIGHVVEYPEAMLNKASEEHGFLDVSQCARVPRIGERLTIIPNHACGTVNMHNTLVGLRGDNVEVVWEIVARGKLQ